MQIAAGHGHVTVVETLIKLGADVNTISIVRVICDQIMKRDLVHASKFSTLRLHNLVHVCSVAWSGRLSYCCT